MKRRRESVHHTGDMARQAVPTYCWLMAMVLALVLGGCFPKEAGKHLEHFATTAPQASEPAPDFVLHDLEGREVRLADVVGDAPVVLQLGSHSCPVYRYRNKHYMDELWSDYGESVRFFIVYTREAHPVGSPSPFTDEEWDVMINRVTGVRVRDATTLEERREQAEASREALELPVPVLVDGIDNQVWQHYGAAASPAFVIDTEGRVADAMPWVDPARIRHTLERLLGPPPTE